LPKLQKLRRPLWYYMTNDVTKCALSFWWNDIVQKTVPRPGTTTSDKWPVTNRDKTCWRTSRRLQLED